MKNGSFGNKDDKSILVLIMGILLLIVGILSFFKEKKDNKELNENEPKQNPKDFI
jgi:uncharacterized membrane protein HdeD (DUF308 family)